MPKQLKYTVEAKDIPVVTKFDKFRVALTPTDVADAIRMWLKYNDAHLDDRTGKTVPLDFAMMPKSGPTGLRMLYLEWQEPHPTQADDATISDDEEEEDMPYVGRKPYPKTDGHGDGDFDQ